MKKIFFSFLVLLFNTFVNAQTITIDNQGYTTQQLVDEVLVVSCTPITNVHASGDATIKSYGYFHRNAGSTFPFDEGVYLTTGSSSQIVDANYASGIAAPTMSYGTTAWGSDSDLETALGTTNMTNATVLEFDFIPTISNISFDYLMLSEEYRGEYPCNYGDGFAFLIKPVAAAAYQNIAVIPTTTTPVAVTTVHSNLTDAGVALSCGASNSAYFDSYYALDTNFNGRTTVLTASTTVTPGQQYHIKLVVADATGNNNADTSFDTAIFLKARGLNLGAVNVDIGPDIAICQGDPNPVLDATVPNANAQYQWQVFDTNTNTYVDVAGETNPTYTVTSTGLYQVILNVDGCLSDDHAQVTISQVPTATTPNDLETCDTDGVIDGITTIDLSTQNAAILNGQDSNTFTVNYYTDAALTTQINNPNNYINTTAYQQTIYAQVVNNTNTSCQSNSISFDVLVYDAPNPLALPNLVVCDINGNGIANFDLSIQDTALLNGQNAADYTINYYQDAALTTVIADPTNYTNTSSPNQQTIYVSIENTAHPMCSSTLNFDLIISNNLAVGQPPKLRECDDDDDGFWIFDLTIQDSVIMAGLNPALYTLTYYEDAALTIPIANPATHQNNPIYLQTIYAQVVNNANPSCNASVQFDIEVFIIPNVTSPPDLSACDTNNDGFTVFDLTQNDTAVLNGQDPTTHTVLYYNDAALTQQIPNPATYTNTTAYNQTIYVVAVNTELPTCQSPGTSFDLNVYDVPQDIPPLDNLFSCDFAANGIANFDLTVQNIAILNGQNPANYTINYYQDAAMTQLIATPNNYDNTTPNLQTIYVGMVNNANSACSATAQFDLIINNTPNITQPNPLRFCDDNNDGFWTFDLTSQEATILNGLSNVDYSILYYEDAAMTQLIATPNNYTNTTAYNKSIYIKVKNNTFAACQNNTILILEVSDTPTATQPSNMETCDNDNTPGAGIGIFDLTSQNTTILNGQSTATFTVNYYINPSHTALITTPSNYQNNTGGAIQTIYAQVINNTNNTCAAETTFTLQTFDTPQPPTVIPPFQNCDTDNDGFQTVDLTNFDTVLLNGHSAADLQISYFLDAALATPVTTPTAFTNTNAYTQQLYATITNILHPACNITVAFDVKIYDTPQAFTPNDVYLCNDGRSANFDMSAQIPAILNGQTNMLVSFYGNQTDANNGNNPLANPFIATVNTGPFTVFVRVENQGYNACADTSVTFIIEAFEAPLPPTTLTTIEVCDDNNDGFFTFDLPALKDNEILNGQNAADFTIRYYTDSALTNEILAPSTFTNTIAITQRIWIKITNNNYNGCDETRFFDLKIYDTPTATQPINMQQCDNDTTVGVGTSTFDLTSQNTVILNGQDPAIFEVHFYTDAALTNEILNPNNYDNITGVNAETIYAQVINTLYNICTATTDFTIQTFDSPTLPNTITPLVYCDDNTDGFHTTDLTQKTSEILNGYAAADFTIHYYTDAALTNEITNPINYTNTTAFTETIYIKVQNNIFNSCEAIGSFELTINPIPTVTNYIDSICDTDGVYDNYTTIDLTQYQNLLTNDTSIVNFYYYTDVVHANQIINPTNFINTQFTQTIYVQVENAATLCTADTDLTITVSAANAEDSTISQCDDLTEDGITIFDLSQANNAILANMSPNVGVTLQKYLNYDDAVNQTNEYTATTYTNTTNPQTIYARVTNNTNPNCFDIATITLEVYSLPDILLEDTYYLCLDQGAVTVDTPTNYVTYRWYNNQGFLLGNTASHIFTSAGDYYLVVTNANNCSKRADFTVEISESPEIIDVAVVDLAADNTLTVTAIGAITGDPAAASHFEYTLDNGPYQSATTFHNVHGGWRLLRVRDIHGCGEVTQRVMVLDYPKFFTPNGDGYNDTWHLFGHEFVDGIEVYIYDRHGKLLKIIYQYDLGWDGEYNGNPIPATDYWFRLQLRDGRTFRSHFSLLR